MLAHQPRASLACREDALVLGQADDGEAALRTEQLEIPMTDVSHAVDVGNGGADKESTGRSFWKLVQTMRSKWLAHCFAVALGSLAMMKFSGLTPSLPASFFFESLCEMA